MEDMDLGAKSLLRGGLRELPVASELIVVASGARVSCEV
jgi:hypothetical protein